LDESCLAHRIEPASGLRNLGRDRREVDDHAAALSSDLRAHRPDHHHGAHDIDVQRLEPVLTRRSQSFIDVGAREVDKEVDAAETLDDLRYEPLDLGIVADVGCREEDSLAEFVGKRPTAVGVDVCDRDVRSLLVEGAHHSPPD